MYAYLKKCYSYLDFILSWDASLLFFLTLVAATLIDLVNFCSKSSQVPPNFRRVLSSRLRRLAAQGKLSNVSNSKSLLNFYKIPDRSETTTRTTPAPKLKRDKYKTPATSVSQEMIDEAAITAACKSCRDRIKYTLLK